MTDQPTREQLLHLVDRARRGVALPAEHDALHQGIVAMAERIATAEDERALDNIALRAIARQRDEAEKGAKQVEADHARVQDRACLLAERLRKAEAALSEQRTATVEVLDASHVTLRRYRERAEQAEDAIERVRRLATRLEEFAEDALKSDDRQLYAAIASDLRAALDEPQPSTTTA